MPNRVHQQHTRIVSYHEVTSTVGREWHDLPIEEVQGNCTWSTPSRGAGGARCRDSVCRSSRPVRYRSPVAFSGLSGSPASCRYDGIHSIPESLVRWTLPEGALGRSARTWMRSGARKAPSLARQWVMSSSVVTVASFVRRTVAPTRWPQSGQCLANAAALAALS